MGHFKVPHSDKLRAYSKALRINVLAYFAAALETKEKGFITLTARLIWIQLNMTLQLVMEPILYNLFTSVISTGVSWRVCYCQSLSI
jgi:hypothetical protein